MRLRPIGTIHTPFGQVAEMPVQPTGALGMAGRIELLPELVEGLRDLDGFSHIIVLYHFHQVTRASLTVIPFLDPHPRGVFATRAPARPNPIGLSVLTLKGVSGSTLEVENVDMLDATPLLDIKPYVPEFDQRTEVRTGWLEKAKGLSLTARSDRRFE